MRAAVAGFTLCGRVSARDTVAVETRASRATSASLAVLLDEPRFTGSRPGKNTGSSLATPVAACKRFHSGSIHAYCYTAHASLLSDPRETSKRQPGPVGARAPLTVFTLSGFAGLIYESIWSHYLKLFLGHAGYAQTLVLAIFMGGMAIGSWLAARYSRNWRNLLLGYAVTEASIGVLALVFHEIFVTVTEAAFDYILPGVGAPAMAAAAKWALGTALILPQSVLLGMTFPLMSGGLIRRYPATPGAVLATLYFTNSLGAGIGVLVAGFAMIEHLGLPGT